MSLSSKSHPRVALERNAVRTGTLVTVALVTLLLSASVIGEEAVDLNVVHRIRQEALQNSQVMEHLFYLTDVHGPRLTNAPGFFAAADWVVKQLKQWGIGAQQEEWGPSGRGWTFTRFSAHLIEPQYAPLIGVPLAYTPGTSGPVTADVAIAVIASEADFAKYRGALRGKIVLLGNGRELSMSTQPLASRRSDSDLAALAVAPEGRGNAAVPGSVAAARGGGGGRGGRGAPPAGAANPVPQRALNQFLAEEGVAVAVRIGGGRSEGGTVFAQSGGSRDPKEPVPPPTIALTPEHYNRIARLLDHGIPVRAQVEVEARFLDDRTTSVNVVGEIPGGRRKDEIVMIGAHLDSWHGGTGATDNAAGSAVMIEVMRILKTLNLRLDRTVRLGLWSGEEQGLLGSRAYVTKHFAAREDMKPKPEHAKLSAYFNIDNGSGKIRGIYLQGNDAVRPIFDTWFKPFADLGASTVSIRNTGGTDHTSFDAVGLPGFQFIQDPLEYDSRTHHSNMDVYDRVQRGDLMQMAAIVASFVYNAANRDELLPRKALPRPQPAPAPAQTTPAAPRTQP